MTLNLTIAYKAEGKNLFTDPVKGETHYNREMLEEELTTIMVRYGFDRLEVTVKNPDPARQENQPSEKLIKRTQ